MSAIAIDKKTPLIITDKYTSVVHDTPVNTELNPQSHPKGIQSLPKSN